MFKKNTAVTGFIVGLVSSTDGSDITTGTPVGYYTLDGGAQTAIGDVTPVHEGNGQWSFDLTAGEMNGDVVGLVFTHASAISAHFTIKTDTKIVSELQDLTAAQVNSEVDTGISDAALATAASLSTAQSDLDKLTGADGATLATSQPNYAPNTVVPDASGVAPTAVEIRQEIDTNSTKTGYSLASTGLDAILVTSTFVAALIKGVWDRVISKANHNVAGSAGKVVRQSGDLIQLDGSISDVGPTTIDFDTDLTGYGDGYFIDAQLLFANGAANGGISKPITGYTSSTGNFQFAAPDAWPITPVDTDDFDIVGLHVHPISQIQLGLATEAKQDIIDTNIDLVLIDTGTTLPALINDLAIKKNTALSNFPFLMVLTSDHVTPATGLTVTGQRRLDNGTFVAVSGTITEVSNGIYEFDALAADNNCDIGTWRFSAATADDVFVPFKTVA